MKLNEQLHWPLVDPNDDGIRPAGRPDECFYCLQRVGSLHNLQCSIVTKIVRVRVDVEIMMNGIKLLNAAGLWTFDEPHSYMPENTEFRLNESSWCKDNFLDEIKNDSVTWDTEGIWLLLKSIKEGREHAGGCLCAAEVLEFTFDAVVDPTPRRRIKPEAQRDRERRN